MVPQNSALHEFAVSFHRHKCVSQTNGNLRSDAIPETPRMNDRNRGRNDLLIKRIFILFFAVVLIALVIIAIVLMNTPPDATRVLSR